MDLYLPNSMEFIIPFTPSAKSLKNALFLRCLPFKSCANRGGIYCLLLTRIFAKMLKNRIKMGQYRWHLYCPRFLANDCNFDKMHLAAVECTPGFKFALISYKCVYIIYTHSIYT